MKKIFILTAMLSFTILSCKKSFIELKPEDSYSPETFYKTESQFRQAVMAAYVPLRDLANNDFYTSEMRSDNTHYQPYPSNRGTAYLYKENIADFTDGPTNTNSNTVYFACYSSISKANIVIGRIADADIPEAAKNDLTGQAKFLRAWNYFKLVRLFGGVPLYLKEVSKAEDAFVSRSTVDEVYAQIISDATDAIAKLVGLDKLPAAEKGRATKGAATMLLAEVYMTQKKYADAEILLTNLGTMGYGLWPTYAQAFLPANKNGIESIFEIQYLEGNTAGTAPSNFIYQFLPRTTNTTIITGTTTNNSATGGWNTPTQDMLDAYEAGDTRKDASIGIAEGVYNGSDQLVISANKSIINYVPAAGKIGVPYIKKYLHTPHVVANNSNDNWPIYRYSDALLLLAESLNEQGKSGLVLAPLNAVRARAFGNTTHNITTTDQTLLRDIIMHERRVELAFENKRWHDLVRWDKAVQVMNAYGVKLKEMYSYLSPASYDVTKERMLYPIPQSEREINPDLFQNPGYN
ncbi:Starch-binding associating with outer membrane [Pedobacter sp. ok626]|uniref:RagB/SusD family nutrient uptake outer membrane protein n=1 Tax=Pedobacter sp. ok626 TaxID=1761882 RepID=UPI000883B10C|nr:RagB/SusD family nutrient uptake outer membrane protein [Pedobacter sp. ok626]SDL01924.1 Starch-binding associating with outer membrane [Pedobacter sp. ok626]